MRHVRLFLVCLTLGFCLPSINVARAANVIYVVSGGAGTQTGDSWANAKDLQPALRTATSGDELWVKAGTYKPTTATVTHYQRISFELKSSVSVYGGFAGTETQRSQRAPRLNTTILSGDILGNDSGNLVPTNPTRQDNSYSVVDAAYSVTNAILDGFLITAGNYRGDGIGTSGSGMRVFYNSSVRVRNVTFWANSAYYGAGMWVGWYSTASLDSVRFITNNALDKGAGLYIDQSSVNIHQSLYSGNNIDNTSTFNTRRGGGIYANKSTVTIKNTTWSSNSVPYTNYETGSAVFNNQSTVTIDNSIVWNNGSSAVNNATITSSIVEYGFAGTNILTSDPLFTNPLGRDSIAGTLDDDLRLKADSPAINAGTNDLLPLDVHDDDYDGDTSETIPFDLAGNPRIDQDIVDMGAYEYTSCPAIQRLYVKHDALGANNGTSWFNAYHSLSDALDAIAECNAQTEIWVSKGTYNPTTSTNDPNATFRIPSGVSVYGGFAGTESQLNQRDFDFNQTILSGDILGNDIHTNSGGYTVRESLYDNIKHVITISDTQNLVKLDGFTITGGNADQNSYNYETYIDGLGGGLLIYDANTIVQNTKFEWNYAGSGAAFSISGSQSQLKNITAYYNRASNGGAMTIYQSHVFIQQSTFISNTASLNSGGAIASYSSHLTINHSLINGNEAWIGGALATNLGNLTLHHVLLNGNSATHGSVIFNDMSNIKIIQSSINANYSSPTVMVGNLNQVTTVRNSIIWGAPLLTNVYPEIVSIQSSLVQNGDTNNGNLNVDPQFVDPDGADNIVGTLDDDLRLHFTSPAINAGNPSLIPTDTLDLDNDRIFDEPVPFDLDLKPRQVGIVDMGAYEYQSNVRRLYLPFVTQ